MKIKMTATRLGAADHINVREYTEGEEYDLPEHLAANFIGQDAAIPTESKASPEKLENKSTTSTESRAKKKKTAAAEAEPETQE